MKKNKFYIKQEVEVMFLNRKRKGFVSLIREMDGDLAYDIDFPELNGGAIYLEKDIEDTQESSLILKRGNK